MAVDPVVTTKYKNLYLQTGRAYLRELQQNIMLLLNNTHSEEAANAVHIAAHSLKSQSLIMGYETTGKLSESIEKIFNARLEKKLTITTDLLQQIENGVKKMQESLDAIERNGKEMDLSEEAKLLQKVSGMKF